MSNSPEPTVIVRMRENRDTSISLGLLMQFVLDLYPSLQALILVILGVQP